MYWKAKPQQVDVTSQIGQNTSKPMQSQVKKMMQHETMAHEYIHAAQVLLDDYHENRVGVPYEELNMRYFKRLREYVKQIKTFMNKNMIAEDDIQDAIDVIRDVESEIVLAGGSFTGFTNNRAVYADPVVFMDRISKISGIVVTKSRKTARKKK